MHRAGVALFAVVADANFRHIPTEEAALAAHARTPADAPNYTWPAIHKPVWIGHNFDTPVVGPTVRRLPNVLPDQFAERRAPLRNVSPLAFAAIAITNPARADVAVRTGNSSEVEL